MTDSCTDFKRIVVKQKVQQVGVSAETVAFNLKKAFESRGGDEINIEISQRTDGYDVPITSKNLWISTPYNLFIDVVQALFDIDTLHFHVISGLDDGDNVTLRYHFSLFSYAERNDRVGVSVIVKVPKSNLVMPSLFYVIPGIEYSERENREMYGVEFDGLPNKALMFLPDQWDEEIKPWRDDEAGLSQKPDTLRRLS
ncbi:MAG: NADH-quinone oxidoreductase subunit C [Synergistaceae bacterium]|nr:NADH-quinone oxidoreductase subunit C [Synergistaceae bacterium]